MHTSAQYHASAAFIKQRLADFSPEILLILGSGLGFMADQMQDAQFIPYAEIPGFKTSTAPGHAGRLAAGYLSGRRVLAMQGRFHLYEGYTPEEAAYPVRVASLLGATRLVTTSACGGVNTAYQVGDLAVLTDLINFTHSSPLRGFDLSGFENRFVDMSTLFDREYRAIAADCAAKLDITLRDGVYFYMLGPEFETPAEIRAIRVLGGDLVGMSTMPECVMARRCDMRILGLSLVTNMAAGVLDQPLSEEEVLREAEKASGHFSALLRALIPQL